MRFCKGVFLGIRLWRLRIHRKEHLELWTSKKLGGIVGSPYGRDYCILWSIFAVHGKSHVMMII